MYRRKGRRRNHWKEVESGYGEPAEPKDVAGNFLGSVPGRRFRALMGAGVEE